MKYIPSLVQGLIVIAAVLFIATLEFLDDYKKAVREAYRVTKPNGKILAMILNPESEYFKEHAQRESSYFRRVRNTNIREIRDYISGFYKITGGGYFLGIRGQEVFESSDKNIPGLELSPTGSQDTENIGLSGFGKNDKDRKGLKDPGGVTSSGSR